MVLKTTIARSAEEMTRLEPLWRRCMEKDRCATIFQSFEWNLAAARHLCEREGPYVIAVEAAEEATIIPAAIADGSMTLLGERLGDYRGILSTNSDGRSMAMAWKLLAETKLDFRFTALRPEHHAVFDQLSTRAFCDAPYLAGKKSDQFAREHSRMFSRQRKLERLCFKICERAASDTELLRWLYRKKAETDAESLFHNAARIAMLLETFGALESCVEVRTLEREGLIIAAVVGFRDRNVLRFYTNWYDVEWAEYSPGMVLLYEMTRRALAAGRSCDYMTGEQPYKMRMASGVAQLRHVHATADEVRVAAEWLARRSLSAGCFV